MLQKMTGRGAARPISALMVFALMLSLFSCFAGVGAQAVTSDDIQDELDELNDQRSEILGRMSEIQDEIDSLDYEKANTLEKKLILDQKNQLAQEELDVIQEQIGIIDGKLAAIQQDLEAARENEQVQKERWLARVRAMEETSQADYLQVLFDSTSFSDLLTRVDLVGNVMEYDEDLEQQYIAARENVEALEGQAETMYAENEARRAELEQKAAQLQADIDAACGLISQIEENSADYESVLAMEAESEAKVASLIMDKEKELKEAKAKEEAARLAALAAQQAAQAAASGGYDTSGLVATGAAWMIWPSYTKLLTSKFGPRYLSLYGYTRPHNGVDVGASYGTAIWAAAGGTVIRAANVGDGYGNCVMINHGNGYTTLYGHMSRIAVVNGQTVSQGQVIGYVGSTGNSTGPHLHFEIRASATAQPINPMAFGYLT